MADPVLQLGGGHIASAGARAYNGSLGAVPTAPRWVLGLWAEPLVRGSAEGILTFICLMESGNFVLGRDFSIYYYFVVASLTEGV